MEDNVGKTGVLDIGLSDHVPIFISRKINSRRLSTEICTTFEPKVVQISACNKKVYKICEICWAIFSSFENISGPNFAILLIL